MEGHNWMGQLPELGRLRIDQLVLPGSHDSGMDKQAPNASLMQEITQDVPCIEQVRAGIRVLDLRVRAYGAYHPADARRWQLYHLSTSGRTLVEDVFRALEDFYAEPDHEREIVILNLHKLDRFDHREHRLLVAAIQRQLAPRLIPWALRELPLETLWREHPGRTLVIAYNAEPRDEGFWPGVNHQWHGRHTLSTTSLKRYMDEAATVPKPDHELRSIQCAKYNKVVFTPDDFSDEIDSWFASVDADSYIQRFWIINTDWSLRSGIVANCIDACRIRALNAR